MNILITSAGQRVSLVRSFKLQLKKTFPYSKVMTTDVQPTLSAACNISDRSFKVNPVTHTSYIDELFKLCVDNDIKIVIPTIDTELNILALHKQRFFENGISLIISDIDFIAKCRDKRKTNNFFLENNIQIPLPYDKKNPRFPLFIKPYDGSRSIDTYIIHESTELTEYHLNNERLMFMEYIDSSLYDEYTVDMYYDRNNYVKCIIPRKRIAIRSGEVLKGITCKNILVQFLKERLGYIKGAIGCITMQFFYNRNDNRILGIEVNPRFGGGFPLSYKAGGNYPGWLMEEYLFNREISYFDKWENNLLMLRYDDEILIHNYKY